MNKSKFSILKPYRKKGDVYIYLEELNNEQKAENDFFKTSDSESAEAELYKSLLLKTQSLLLFEDIIQRHNIIFKGNLLELAGGYGYLSAYIKKKFPGLTVIYSDVSKEAVEKSKQYENFFNVNIDEKWITSAEDTPFSDNMFDNILFFASFHHIQRPQIAVRECARILKPDGRLLLLLEPMCPSYLKKLYFLHVKREKIKEKYYTIREYKSFFKEAGLTFEAHNYKNYIYRWSKNVTLYYLLLNFFPDFITRFLPCTQVIIGKKLDLI